MEGSEAESRGGPCRVVLGVLGIKGSSGEALVRRERKMKTGGAYRLSCQDLIRWLLAY